MKKTNTKKLALRPETIKALFTPELPLVAGARPSTLSFGGICPTLYRTCTD
jgi:hypothetical protein